MGIYVYRCIDCNQDIREESSDSYSRGGNIGLAICRDCTHKAVENMEDCSLMGKRIINWAPIMKEVLDGTPVAAVARKHDVNVSMVYYHLANEKSN